MPVNPERSKFVDDFIRTLPNGPGFDPFVDFMRTLSTDQQEAVVKFMMARKLSTLAPHWVTFAITATLIENMQQAVHAVDVPISTALQKTDRMVRAMDMTVAHARDLLKSTPSAIHATIDEGLRAHDERWRLELNSLRRRDRGDVKVIAGLLGLVATAVLILGLWLGWKIGFQVNENGARGREIYAEIRSQVLTNMLREAKTRGQTGVVKYVRERLRQ